MNLQNKKRELQKRIDSREREIARLMVGAHNLLSFAERTNSTSLNIALESYIHALCELGESMEEAAEDYLQVCTDIYLDEKNMKPKDFADHKQALMQRVTSMKTSVDNVAQQLQEMLASKL